MDILSGRAWVFGDDINTDVIHPPEFFSLDPEIVRVGMFHGYDPNMQKKVQPGDILVAGRNFGCGSSRETSIQSLVLNGIGAVVAIDFARIFFRNAINVGLPCLQLSNPAELALLNSGETLEISVGASVIVTENGKRIRVKSIGSFVKTILDAGGLIGLLES